MKKKSRITLSVVLVLVLACTLLITACEKCEHNFQNGKCIKCQQTDPNYKAPSCVHSYVNGTCEKCGATCAHSYTDGYCTKCGAACTHSYTDGVCALCAKICTHTFFKGSCTACGTLCTHTYNEGICVTCGAEDPNYLPEKGRLLYDEIIDKFKYLVLYKYTYQELPSKGDDEPFYTDALYEVVGQYDPAMTLGYSFKDINGDGFDELLLMENKSRLYAMFSIKDKAPVVVATFQSGQGYLKDDGTVFFNTKNGYKFLGNHITRLVDGELVGIVYGWEDPDDDIANGNDIYYYVSEDGTKTYIPKDEYDVIKNEYLYYWENATRLTKLSNLMFHPTLIAPITSSPKADFSTYDAIIKTFGEMHTMAVDGKWYRSAWIGGRYDEGMIFKTEADFVLYNKLLAAYFLMSEDPSATVGYAKKDLNGDGTEELVLLDGSFNVFAIFTEVDGAAVLLDSYNDLKKAFIDADGLIHVSKRIIPGYKNNEKKDGYSKYDYEAFVYEVGVGALVEKVAIGIKYDTDGAQGAIYKIVDGTPVKVEQAEWDALYAMYAKDLGDATFATYTKENSGLVVVAVPAA